MSLNLHYLRPPRRFKDEPFTSEECADMLSEASDRIIGRSKYHQIVDRFAVHLTTREELVQQIGRSGIVRRRCAHRCDAYMQNPSRHNG